MRLQEQVALVIGGAGGIGAATARMLAEEGARVAITHTLRSAERAAQIVERLPGGGHVSLPADVAETRSLEALRERIEAWSGGTLNILVNSAGFTKPIPHGDLEALDDALIDRMFAVNWRGQFAAIRVFAPLLTASGNGLIVSISSVAGQTGTGSSIAYCAAKAGIDVMTKSLARVLAPAVRVIGVAPGVVDTKFVPGRDAAFNQNTAQATPLQRVATADDVAEAVLACATSLRFATGTTLVVDGGRSL